MNFIKNVPIFIFSSCIVFVLFFSSLSSGSQIDNEILGKWKLASGEDTLEFFSDKTVIYYEKNDGQMVGDYSFLDNSRIKMQFGGKFSILGPLLLQILSISDNKMTVELLNKRYEYIKMTEVMILYEKGKELYSQKRYEEAESYFSKAAMKGYNEAQLRLGLMYLYDDNYKNNEKKAYSLLLNSAKQNNVQAQYILGNLYMAGQVVEKDYESAINWMQKAADQNYLDAYNSLAWFYATCDNEKFLDRNKAVKYALITTSKDPTKFSYQDTLAAAYARDGQFNKAIEAQRKALDLLSNNNEITAEKKTLSRKHFGERLRLYRKSIAYDQKYDLNAGRDQAIQLFEQSKKISAVEYRYAFIGRQTKHVGELTDVCIIDFRCGNCTNFADYRNKNFHPQEIPLWYGHIKNIKMEYREWAKDYSLDVQGDRWNLGFTSKDQNEISSLYNALLKAISNWYVKYGEIAPLIEKPNFLSNVSSNSSFPQSQQDSSTKPQNDTVKPPSGLSNNENNEMKNNNKQSSIIKESLLIDIQKELFRLDYYKLKVDGLYGPATESAIKSYQKDSNLIPDGKPSEKLLSHLQSNHIANRQSVEKEKKTEEIKNEESRTLSENIEKTVDNVVRGIVDAIFGKK